MAIKPRGGDKAMERVFTPDLDPESNEPLKHGPSSYKAGGGIRKWNR